MNLFKKLKKKPIKPFHCSIDKASYHEFISFDDAETWGMGHYSPWANAYKKYFFSQMPDIKSTAHCCLKNQLNFTADIATAKSMIISGTIPRHPHFQKYPFTLQPWQMPFCLHQQPIRVWLHTARYLLSLSRPSLKLMKMKRYTVKTAL